MSALGSDFVRISQNTTRRTRSAKDQRVMFMPLERGIVPARQG